MFYDIGYTAYNCCGLLLCPFIPEELRRALYPVIACSSWGILTTFHAGALIDATVFDRLAKKYRLCRGQWDFLNFVSHLVPTIVVSYWQPLSISHYHGVISACMNYSWILLVSKGTWILDRVYVPCEKKTWYTLVPLLLITELMTPFVYKTIKRFRRALH